MQDQAKLLQEQVRAAIGKQTPLVIEGSGSKRFYGYPPSSGLGLLNMSGHTGVIDYEPAELVLRVRAGTLLSEINKLLRENNQVLAFEPPDFEANSTIGGAIASGLSGPRRPYAGSARDFVLGVTLITGQGDILEFGGQVMKNVAGYDVSRLLTGSLGTLGVILDVSLKVLPAPELEISRAIRVSRHDFQALLRSMRGNIPISAAAHQGDSLKVRLSGSQVAVNTGLRKIDGDETGVIYWDTLNTLACFSGCENLWRTSVAPASSLFLEDAVVIDWGGGIRWLADPAYDPRELLAAKKRKGEDGHATLVKYNMDSLSPKTEIFQPLDGRLMAIHKKLKQQFDPARIFNPGRMYRDI